MSMQVRTYRFGEMSLTQADEVMKKLGFAGGSNGAGVKTYVAPDRVAYVYFAGENVDYIGFHVAEQNDPLGLSFLDAKIRELRPDAR